MKFLKYYLFEFKSIKIFIFCWLTSLILTFATQNFGVLIGITVIALIDMLEEYQEYKEKN